MTRDARVRHVGVNAFFLFLAYAAPRACLLVAVAVAARALGTAAFGAYGTAAGVAVILSVVATLGMHPLLVRDFARAPANAPALMRAAHAVKTGANVVMIASAALAALLLGLPRDAATAVLILALGYVLAAYVDNFSAYVQAAERMHIWAEAAAALGVVAGVSGVALALAFRSVPAFCVASVLGEAAALAWLVYRMPSDVRRGRRVARGDIRALVRATLPFAAAFFALTLYTKVDIVLLARWRAASEVGVYAAAYKALDVVQALTVVAIGAVYPRLARATGDAAGGRGACERVLELAWLTSIPVAAAVFLLRGPAITIVFGSAYAAAVPLLAILAAVIPPLVVNLAGGYVLAVRGGMGWMAGAYALGAVGNIALNAALIPVWGGRGAAIAVLVTEAALAGVLLLGVRRRAGIALPRRAIVLGGFALGGAALAARLEAATGEVWAFTMYAVALAAAFGVASIRARRAVRLTFPVR